MANDEADPKYLLQISPGSCNQFQVLMSSRGHKVIKHVRIYLRFRLDKHFRSSILNSLV